MLPIYFYITFAYVFINTEALKIDSVSAKNIIKRESGSDLFPQDFLPFKKQSEEFEELKQKIKSKPKKRLAPPVSFLLRAAESESDDYYEKGQGDSDGDDDYEKKDWSDANRPLDPIDKSEKVNHTEVSEIDGVVNIIVGKPYALKTLKRPKSEPMTKNTKQEIVSEKGVPKNNPAQMKLQKYDEEVDYDEEENEKKKPNPIPDEAQNLNDDKKTGILDSVDDLKERHAQEQRAINEKLKEEEMYVEQHERDRIFNAKSNKYDENGTQKANKLVLPDYDEYEDKHPVDTLVTPKRIKSSTSRAENRATRRKEKTSKKYDGKKLETGKISVFKDPQLFMIYDEDAEDTTKTPKPNKTKSQTTRKNKKYSSSNTSPPPNVDDIERISLLPADENGRSGEPALFFPKKRKNKKNMRKITLNPADSIVAETVYDNQAKKLTTEIAAPMKGDLSKTETVTADIVVAASDHTAKTKDENYHREKGGSKQYSSSHEEDHHEEGKKAYEGVHKETKTAEGHHEKENHLGKYDDHGDINKHHEEESEHYGAHSHEEHGKKHAKYEESGKHSKGHNTKGSHNIHKKEEYEKKVEFFEEEGDSAEEEKNGGYHQDKGHSEGGHFKKNSLKAGHEKQSKGESGDHANGWLLNLSKGHKSAGGNDGHHKDGEEHASKGTKKSGKKWIFHHGSPARTSNLVDRRADQYYQGHKFYG